MLFGRHKRGLLVSYAFVFYWGLIFNRPYFIDMPGTIRWDCTLILFLGLVWLYCLLQECSKKASGGLPVGNRPIPAIQEKVVEPFTIVALTFLQGLFLLQLFLPVQIFLRFLPLRYHKKLQIKQRKEKPIFFGYLRVLHYLKAV